MAAVRMIVATGSSSSTERRIVHEDAHTRDQAFGSLCCIPLEFDLQQSVRGAKLVLDKMAAGVWPCDISSPSGKEIDATVLIVQSRASKMLCVPGPTTNEGRRR
jgi:hypothetical protein